MALHVRALLVVVGAPCLSGFIVPPAPLSRVASSGQWQAHLPQRQRLPVMAVSEKEEAELDKLVRAEIEAAFAGLEEKFANGEDEEAIEIIRTQGKTVLSNVLEKLEEDGQLLSGQLASRIEELAEDQSTQLLARYEGEIDRTRAQMDVERANIRNEVERLEALNKELQELQGGAGLSFNRNKIVGGLAFLVGLTGLGASINEGLKFAFSTGSADAFALVSNLLLGVAGLYVYFTRK